MLRPILAAIGVLFAANATAVEIPRELRVGRAGHAFDHLGDIGEQAQTAAASGANILYTTGLGVWGYQGLPPEAEFKTAREKVTEYNQRAKHDGIKLALGYLCATSIVKLDSFDKNWTKDFRAQFKTQPAEWRQQDRQGKPLASWYGGDYAPACMNHPDWRAYERAMVRYQLESGHDGIFFDNPTVHPQGCYCPHCMRAFVEFIKTSPPKVGINTLPNDVKSARELADSWPDLFLRFRATIARDFLADMRTFARSLNPHALITCNNSLNSPDVFYSQCRMYGYNIEELSEAEDFVVVEDMATQPRTEANGQTIEYGPTYKMLHAISHEKPIVAVTLAGGDYHTPPDLMRLAMAEAAAHNASYLSWPTWPEDQRKRMSAAVLPLVNFLQRNEKLLNDAPFRADVILFSPSWLWRKTDNCATSEVAATLTRENIQYKVISDINLLDLLIEKASKRQVHPILVVESPSVLPDGGQTSFAELEQRKLGVIAADKPGWVDTLRAAIGSPSLKIEGPPGVRAVVHDQDGFVIVHIYNLNVQRLSSFEDKVTPARDVKLSVSAPFDVRAVNLQTADNNNNNNNTAGTLKFTLTDKGAGQVVSVSIPRLDVSAIITIEE